MRKLLKKLEAYYNQKIDVNPAFSVKQPKRK
jgi:hypothetical protein